MHPQAGLSRRQSGNHQGGTDQAQIYIALTDEPVEVRTDPNNQKLFMQSDPHVIAYGQVTWKEAFGPTDSSR